MSSTLTIDDLLNLRQVSEAQVHPDGAPIVYTVSSTVVEARESRGFSEIWVTSGGEARRLTATGTWARCPRWSADGARLGFIGRRADQGNDQFFMLDLGWTEARQLTGSGGGVRHFAWSPDGVRTALLITDEPPAGEDERRAEGRDEIEFERHQPFDRLWICDTNSGGMRRATDVDLHVWEFEWSPDGERLVAIVSDEPQITAWYRARLVTIDLRTGAVTTIYQPPKTITRPTWSPDGQRIALLSCTWSDPGMTGGDILLLDLSGEEPVNITSGQPRSFVTVDWERSGDGLIAFAVEDGQSSFCRVDLDGTCHRLWRERVAIDIYQRSICSRDRSGNRIAVVRSDPANPAEVWTIDLEDTGADGGLAWTRHSDTNPQVEDIQLNPIETHYWRSFDGSTIQGLLIRPAGTKPGTRLPLVVLIHGGPTGVTRYDYANFRQMGWAHLLAQAGYAALLPNPRGSMGFGTPFAEANLGDMGGGDLADVLAGVDYCIESGIADPERLGVGGWSYGGYLTSWAVTQTSRFKAAVAGATITDWTAFHGSSSIPDFDAIFFGSDPYDAGGIYTARSPIYHVRNVQTPVLFLHGEKDTGCPLGQAQGMWRALKERGVETELVIYPRAGHWPREREHVRDVVERLVGWFTSRV